MEDVCCRNPKTLIAALMQGRESANHLKIQLQPPKSEKCEFFMEKIVSSFDISITLLKSMALLENGSPSHITGNISESPDLPENSPKSEGSDPDYKDQTHKDVFKKRKITQKRSELVRVYSGAGLESHLNDGYSWRKYGQKVILNSNYPRAYYRCTHLNTQRCLAKKQVQRIDDDPSTFEVLYIGKHSCIQETIKQNKDNFCTRNKEEDGVKNAQEMVFGINPGPGLKVETQELNVTVDGMANFPSFSFPSNPVESEDSEDTRLFLDLTQDTYFIGSYSTPFISPATSESYFSLSQGQANGFGIGNNFSSESDFADIVSNAMSLTFGDLDSSIHPVDFDAKLLDAFDNFC